MGLKQSVNPPGGGTDEDAYMRTCRRNIDDEHESGKFEIQVWKDKSYKDAGNTRLAICEIRIGSEEVKDGTDVLRQLAYSSIADLTRGQLYVLLKTYKIQFKKCTQVLDLSLAEDVFEEGQP